MIRDFGSFTRRGLLRTLSALRKYGGDKLQTEQEGRHRKGDGRRQKDHRPACGERVRGPKTQLKYFLFEEVPIQALSKYFLFEEVPIQALG